MEEDNLQRKEEAMGWRNENERGTKELNEVHWLEY
jgi:hypothetical protein